MIVPQGILSPEVDEVVIPLSDARPPLPPAVAQALKAEQQRRPDGMRALWRSILLQYPAQEIACRMTLRWYRRDKRIAEGRALLARLYPRAGSDPQAALMMLHGLVELHAEAEIDRIAGDCLTHMPDAPTLRMTYARHLAIRGRYNRAAQVLATSPRPLSPQDADFQRAMQRKAGILSRLTPTADADAVPHVIHTLSQNFPPRPHRTGAPVSFFSGSLGPGGAERQMTRIAAALGAERHVDVVLRNLSHRGNADFFKGELTGAGVPVHALPHLESHTLPTPALADLLSLLPDSLRMDCLRLAHHYAKRRPGAVYLWQDGAVLAGVLAALLAGVPRIVTSFRGLPPPERPELLRPHMLSCFPVIARLSQLRLTANSTPGARAYEAWLDMPAGSVSVIRNASPPARATATGDSPLWREIEAKSPRCDKTVLGIFRHDPNKRARQWIEVAALLAQTDKSVRFVVLGQGGDHARNLRRVHDLGLQHRIFLPGLCKDVEAMLARADLLMHLPRLEGSPNALIEAQAAGVPVLCTPAGNSAQIMCHGQTGHLLPRADRLNIGQTAQVLARLLSDPQGLRRMGRAGRDHCTTRFSLGDALARTRAVLDP